MPGGCTKALVVRDLASSRLLTLKAVPAEDAASAVACLTELFTEHGPPLVLKADNGSAFISDDVLELCCQHRVVVLYSPPLSPWYQGSIETGMNAIRDAVDEIVARKGRQGQWTQDDLDQALCMLNLRAMPSRDGAVPSEVWRYAQAITTAERQRFYERYSKNVTEPRGDPVAERAHIRDILQDTGLLHIQQVWIKRRQPKRGIVRHVAGKLTEIARLLDITYTELCAHARQQLMEPTVATATRPGDALDPPVIQLYNALCALQTA
jgi:hypothetical protein